MLIKLIDIKRQREYRRHDIVVPFNPYPANTNITTIFILGNLDSFMLGSYPVSLRNIGGSAQIQMIVLKIKLCLTTLIEKE